MSAFGNQQPQVVVAQAVLVPDDGSGKVASAPPQFQQQTQNQPQSLVPATPLVTAGQMEHLYVSTCMAYRNCLYSRKRCPDLMPIWPDLLDQIDLDVLGLTGYGGWPVHGPVELGRTRAGRWPDPVRTYRDI